MFQVINPRPSESGKPDVEIASRIVRLTGARAEPVASLKPLTYSADTHARAVRSPPGAPGVRRVVGAARDARPRQLSPRDHRERSQRPPLGDLRRGVHGGRDAAIAPARSAAAGGALRERGRSPIRRVAPTSCRRSSRPSPSPALQRALDKAAAGNYVGLMVDEPVGKGEEAVRAALSGLALLGVGDPSSAVQFQRAVLLGAPVAPSRLLSGFARALQGRDTDAIAAWQEALKAGVPRALVAPLLLDAYVRRGEFARAAQRSIAETTAPAGGSELGTQCRRHCARDATGSRGPQDPRRAPRQRPERSARAVAAPPGALHADCRWRRLEAGALRDRGAGLHRREGHRTPRWPRIGIGRPPRRSDYFFLRGGGAGGFPSVFSEYALRDATSTPGRSTLTSSSLTRFIGSGFDE